ncbi:MAG: MEDS domain-containing protein [Lapillicoccus sp.]
MHEVKFYDHDTELVDLVARRAAEELEHEAGVVLVASASHLCEIEAALAGRGVDVESVRCAGPLLTVSAAEALTGVMVAEALDPDLFMAKIGAMLDAVGGSNRKVWAYGELAPWLCAAGNPRGAADLETLCNDLVGSRQVSILCGYPTSLLDFLSLTDVDGSCRSHDHVVAPSGYRSSPVTSAPQHLRPWKVLVPVPEAVGAARAFVGDVLGHWGEASEQVDDAVLLASEMATNAVIHARSPFRISVAKSGEGITVAVQDVADRRPQLGTGDTRSDTGRGLAIVAALSTGWGCDDVPSGKVVWSELSPTSQHAS